MRSRKYEHEIFNKHEKSKHHQQALSELNKSSYCLSTSMTANINEMINTDNSSSNHHHNNHNSMNTISNNSVYDECEGYRTSNGIQDNHNGRINNSSIQENYQFINNIHNSNISNNLILNNSMIYDVIANNNSSNSNNNNNNNNNNASNNNAFNNIENNKQNIRTSYPSSQGSVVTSLASQINHNNEISSNSSSSSWGSSNRGKNDGNRIHDNSVGHGNSLDYDFDSQHPAHEHALMLAAIAHGMYLRTVILILNLLIYLFHIS